LGRLSGVVSVFRSFSLVWQAAAEVWHGSHTESGKKMKPLFGLDNWE
jgi:hypothetical protein